MTIAALRPALDGAADAEPLAALGRGAPAPAARCIHEVIAERAATDPDAVALSAGPDTLSYRGLVTAAERLGRILRERGVGPDSVVAVLAPRSVDLVVTLLGVLTAGGAYLALDPADPADRHAQLVRDSAARLLVVDPTLSDRAPEGIPLLEPGATAIPDIVPAVHQPAAPMHPDLLAYISYTSGSTGEPKGVAVPHRAVSRLVREPDWIDIGADDVFLQLAPVTFDASTLEIWAPLVNGARLAIAPPGPVALDQLAATLHAERVTVLWLTAGLFHQMVTSQLQAFAAVRHVIAGGDVISPVHLSRLLTAHPGLRFTNGYGPTENTTFTACWTTTSAPTGSSVPIGRPIRGTHVAVLDAAGRPVANGADGELYAAGDGVARGYLHLPGATAGRFVPDSVSGRSGARMYRTGDLARWGTDGTLEFLGRADQQVKVNGYRVEPGAVETELIRDEEVRDAVVVAQADEAGGKRLIAYVVAARPDPNRDLGTRLRARLAARLPAYLVPWAVLLRDELPLSATGKVDRRSLPAATRVPRNVWNDFVAPATAVQARLAALWGEVLGVEPIGVEDDFFDLGGHSLIAAELLSSLAAEYRIELPARVLYLQPTIAELAAEIDRRQDALAAPGRLA